MKINIKQGNSIPMAIIVAGLLVAGAVVFSGAAGESDSVAALKNTGGQPNHAESQSPGEFRMPDETDHIRGNLDAPVKIVEFSDLECPFCARLHPTLTRVARENEDIAWVYRHFPLSSHSNAFSAAIASECVAKLGGNDAFWNFTDSAFANQRNLGSKFYEKFAQESGFDTNAFSACLNDKEIRTGIQQDLDEVIAIGGRGTPFVVVVTPGGDLMPFSGALPYEQVMSVVEHARDN